MLSARLWCKWNVDVTLWLHECWHGVGANEVLTWLHGFMNVGMTSVQMKFWRGFMNVGTASVRMKCWHSFMAKTSIGMTPVLIWSVDVTSWLHECWHSFSTNEVLNVGTTSVWMKCRCGLNANKMLRQLYEKKKKKSASTASLQRQMMVWLHNKCKCKYCFTAKMNVGMASVQGQMLAQLHGKDSWCGYFAKTLEMATLKRQVLVQLNCQKKHAA